MTVSAVVALAGAASAVGLSGGLGGEDRAVATNPQPTREMAVYVCTESAPKETSCHGRDATLDELEAIKGDLTRLPGVESIFFVDQVSSYESFRREYAHDKALLDEVKVTDMPPSFRVKIKEGAAEGAVRDIGGIAGVRSVLVLPSPDETIRVNRDRTMNVFLCGKGTELPSCKTEVTREEDGVVRTVLVGKGVTKAQKDAIEKIAKAPEVESYVFESQEMAYEDFRRTNSKNQVLLQATQVKDMPQSFRLTMKQGADWVKIFNMMKRQPGVARVFYNPCLADEITMRYGYGLSLPESTGCEDKIR
ncbi:permease-like cell division protein FtsX [Nonomuraea sp. B12E4]|uniref:permease-like cell division protein FtsX n=1 Tax=Nonomuraea sp. B12E4 TaxID=3153564 RepID=UPI00325E3D5E